MVNRIEIERLLQSKELKELWQTIQQELPQLHFCEENDFWEEARIDYLENYISECNTLLCNCNFQEISIKDLYTYLPQFGIRYRLVVYEDSVTNPLPVPLSTGNI